MHIIRPWHQIMQPRRRVVVAEEEEEFSPLDISGCKLWLDGSDADTLFQDAAMTTPVANDGDVIGGWQDKSGNGNNATQATTAKKPLYKVGIQNGLSVAQSDGIDDYLKAAAFTWNQPEYIFVVIRQISWGSNDMAFDGETFTSMILQQKTSSPTMRLYAGNDGPSTAALPIGTFGILTCLFNGAASELRLNGGSPITGNAGLSNAGGFAIFASAGGTNCGNFDIGEVLGYGAISDSNRQKIVSWLSTKWNISLA